MVATTDPATLPAQSTWYLATDLPGPADHGRRTARAVVVVRDDHRPLTVRDLGDCGGTGPRAARSHRRTGPAASATGLVAARSSGATRPPPGSGRLDPGELLLGEPDVERGRVLPQMRGRGRARDREDRSVRSTGASGWVYSGNLTDGGSEYEC
ncbi:hypothetical protein OG883_39885 [Streptomyces sp. NBC_01142]|uniref:hypothetical protein n=1 Tax=Streptomyces sp. NBC_01142 TaxID=2975865 RepID=UPI0022598943|nr:hypothetical protein [Streptomyces sp. NBC_01142]MCX4825870.1 hypothetical protein [Streptomyces sp. NBC_01142]